MVQTMNIGITTMMSLTALSASVKATEAAMPKIKVGLFLDKGCFGNGTLLWTRLLANSPQLELTLLDGQDVRYGNLSDLQLLVCPGGGGSRQINSMGPIGFERVKKFVDDGGSYLGICAGSYNAMNRPNRFAFLPYDYVDDANGRLADLLVEVTDAGSKLLGLKAGRRIVCYDGGNVMRPTEPTGKGDSQILITFKSCVSEHGRAPYNFMDTPAVVFGQYGKGKVVACSFHPELYESTHCIAMGCIHALTGIQPVVQYPKKDIRPLRVGFLSDACVGPQPAREMLELDKKSNLDIEIFSTHEINIGRLRHYDMVVMPDGNESSYKDMMDREFNKNQFYDFLDRGGRIVAANSVGKYLPQHDNIQILSADEPLTSVL
jgi:glutamine amidotransferase-like uncharacterized protein